LWGLLLGISALLGLASHFTDVGSPAFDIAFTAAAAAVVVLFCRTNRSGVSPLLRAPAPLVRSGLFALLAFAAWFAFMSAYCRLFEWLGIPFFEYLDDYVEHGWPLWPAVLTFVVAPGIFEELAFRGVITARLESMMRPLEAALVQAILFSVLHLLPLIFVSHFVFGLMLAWLRLKTKSLYPGMAVHMAWNGWVLLEEFTALRAA
jgi:membrane protease YdiL (CAAX protease family)